MILITDKICLYQDLSKFEIRNRESHQNSDFLSLEQELEKEGCWQIDLDQWCSFYDFLEPNEGNPQKLIPHLQEISKKGVVVSTGTERSFFFLLFLVKLLANKNLCEGLIIKDINPKVKAYVDFNVLLLRITKTVEEYRELSERIEKKMIENA
jgi:hypothetical protein